MGHPHLEGCGRRGTKGGDAAEPRRLEVAAAPEWCIFTPRCTLKRTAKEMRLDGHEAGTAQAERAQYGHREGRGCARHRGQSVTLGSSVPPLREPKFLYFSNTTVTRSQGNMDLSLPTTVWRGRWRQPAEPATAHARVCVSVPARRHRRARRHSTAAALAAHARTAD